MRIIVATSGIVCFLFASLIVYHHFFRYRVLKTMTVETVWARVTSTGREDETGEMIALLPQYKWFTMTRLDIQGEYYTDLTRPSILCCLLGAENTVSSTNKKTYCFSFDMVDAKGKRIGKQELCHFSGEPVRVCICTNYFATIQCGPKKEVALIGKKDGTVMQVIWLPTSWAPVP